MGNIGTTAGQDIVSAEAPKWATQARDGFDPKRNVVVWKDSLAIEGKPFKAIVFRTGRDVVDRFVVAHGYDPQTGEWSYGSYHSTFISALEAADDSILGVFIVGDGDVSSSLERHGFQANAKNISTVLAGARRGDNSLDERVQAAINAAVNKAVADYGECGDLEK